MAMTLITTNTSSGAATSDFTSGIDSTYKLYIFKFYDVDPVARSNFSFQGSTDSGSNYGVAITSTYFSAEHAEADNVAALSYRTGKDLAQSTSFQPLTSETTPDSDASAVGELYLFNPSDTTYVKHFYSTTNDYADSTHNDTADISKHTFIGGYFNTTSAIDAIQFKMSTGNMDAVIKMYGVG